MLIIQIIVEKPVDNYVENLVYNQQFTIPKPEVVDIHRFIQWLFVSFPQFFAEKRYKLIIFAPKMEIVDKLLYWFIIRK